MVARGRPSRFRGCVGAAVVAAAFVLSSPGLAHAEEPRAPEADTNPTTAPPPSTRPNLVLVGAAVTVGWYGAAYGMSYLWPDSDGASALRVPIAGPYMALAKTGCSSAEPDCGTFTVVLRTILTGLSAVGQTGGVLAMLEGVFVPTSATAAPSPRGARREKTHVAIVPTLPASGGSGANGLGFGVFGEF